MQSRSKSPPGYFARCSGRMVLECRCGEMVVLLGRKDDWYSEGHMLFECECGRRLTPANRVYEEAAPRR